MPLGLSLVCRRELKQKSKIENCCIVEGKHIQVLFVWLSNYDQLPSTQHNKKLAKGEVLKAHYYQQRKLGWEIVHE